jgi:hypothetical protein
MKKIICFLCVRPTLSFYNFCKLLQNDKYDVFITIDDNNYNIPSYDGLVKIIKIDSLFCESKGYKSSVLWHNNKALSRDKALFFFNTLYTTYDHIWFIEEDVFIPTVETIKNIDHKYGDESSDLIVNQHKIFLQRETNWHWNYIYNQIKIDVPFGNSYICAIRCSRKLMKCIHEYVCKYNNLFMDEVLFNTIALHNHLDVVVAEELSTMEWRRDWQLHEIQKTNLYHPIKCMDTQEMYRSIINF